VGLVGLALDGLCGAQSPGNNSHLRDIGCSRILESGLWHSGAGQHSDVVTSNGDGRALLATGQHAVGLTLTGGAVRQEGDVVSVRAQTPVEKRSDLFTDWKGFK
jgi:hypothetical protein